MARLPELEWKINELGSFFSSHRLPKGLFRIDEGVSGVACIAEIKADIHALSKQQNRQSAFYLAERIRRKINVLVVLCQMHQTSNKPEEKRSFGIKMLSTRRQWINDLEAEIKTLEEQQQAMTKALEHLRHNHNSSAILHLKAELGEVARRLTLAKETLNRAVS
ncbi:coiled-coil protein [Legionella steigerwaltii]|uniref:Coiled-coil protein n=2 Tax=Legionella steigerwaltii TaxID=460 RepID=A0A378L8C7_9GAMM|nr:coiled-coil protein [Legionella steigerwaltii]STY21929.1 coiled-coil protein [Legionella steigerwaltii]